MFIDDKVKIDFWIVLLVSDAVFSQLRSVTPALYRMSLYFGMIKIFAYPFLTRAFTIRSQKIVRIIITLSLLIIWYYQIVLQGNEDVYPYVSDVIWWLN